MNKRAFFFSPILEERRHLVKAKTSKKPAGSKKAKSTTNQALTVAPKTPLRKIWLSKFLDPDWLEGIREMRMSVEAEKELPGNKTAEIELMEAGMRKSPEQMEEMEKGGELVFGSGGGRFGQYGALQTDVVRSEFGIVPDRGLTKIGAALRRAKRDKGSMSELPRMLEKLGEVVRLENVVRDGIRILNYLHHGINRRRVSKIDDGTLEEYLEELCTSKNGQPARFTHERAIANLRKIVKASVDNKHNSVFELAYIKDCLVCRDGPQDARRVVGNLLCSLYQGEVDYWDAIALCKKAKKHPIPFAQKKRDANGRVLKDDQGRDDYEEEPFMVNAVFVETDNLQIPRASHNKEEVGDIGIVIVMNSRGNLGIYIDNRLPKEINDDVNLIALWKMIQSLELMEQGVRGENIDWDSLPKLQAHPDVAEYWRFVPKHRQILNGIKQGDVPKSLIERTDRFLDALEHAFHLFYIPNWKKNHGIPHVSKGRKPAQNQPTSGAKPTVDSKPKTGAKTSVDSKTPKVKRPKAKIKAKKSTGTKVPADPVPEKTSQAGNDLASALEAAENAKKNAANKK